MPHVFRDIKRSGEISGNGESGYSGPSGFSGYSGSSGFSGYSGRSGFSGYSGSGFSGYSGYSGVLPSLPETIVYTDTVQNISGDKTLTNGIIYLKSNGLGTAGYIQCNTAAGETGGFLKISTGGATGAAVGGNGGQLTFLGGVGGSSTGVGGAAGTVTLSGGNGGSTAAGGAAGAINLSGGNADLTRIGGAGGSITMVGGTAVNPIGGAVAGSLITSANVSRAGGTIDTSAGGTAGGGAITTSNGGGAINTTGTGSIELGVVATRTTLHGSGSTVTLTCPAVTSTLLGMASTTTTAGHLISTTTTAGGTQHHSDLTWISTILSVDGAAIFNETGNDVDFRIETNNQANAFFVDGGTDCVGIHTGSPGTNSTQCLTLVVPSGTGSQAMEIDCTQGTATAPFIDYRGDSTAAVSTNISTRITDWGLAGMIKIEINGTSQWMPYYTDIGGG